MDVRSNLISCLTAVVLILSACSSTTVVASGNRAGTTPTESTNADPTESTVDSDQARDTASAADDDNDNDDTDQGTPEDQDIDPADEDPTQDTDEAGESPAETEPNEDGFGLGGAEQLEDLTNDCTGGSDLACDILFQLADVDTEAEVVALTCGGRSEARVIFCTSDMEPDENTAAFSGDSDGLAVVVSACEDDADMTACDFLYYRSPLDSTYEEIGASCGGRVQVAVPDCRTYLAE